MMGKAVACLRTHVPHTMHAHNTLTVHVDAVLKARRHPLCVGDGRDGYAVGAPVTHTAR